MTHSLPGKEKLTDFLGSIPLFAGAGSEVLTHLAERVQLTSHQDGELIIRKGEPGESMYLILSGTMKVHDGEHEVARLGAGQFFGELSLLDREPRSMSVSTVDETVLGCIDRKDFFDVLNGFPAMMQDMIAVLNRRLRNQNSVLISEYRSREEKLTELVRIRTAEVMQQNLVIAEKNREMTASLNYASRLQAAILPKTEPIGDIFRDYFVLYMPKDIVSGDFYSVETSGDKVVIAAADCTGHGVSGAIMSMIGSSLLKKIIVEKGIAEPAEILKQLNEGVIESLRQAENNTHDGMDIAVCTYDITRHTLKFAGANRPLWLVRDGNLEAYASDKLPIGGLQVERNRPFRNADIPVQKGDTVYIFSDGYADQFGGEQGKKLMTKKFREILLQISSRPFREQRDYLEQFSLSWRGQAEQTDDILVIGLGF